MQTNQDQEQKRNLPDPNSQQYRAHLSRKLRIKRKQDDDSEIFDITMNQKWPLAGLLLQEMTLGLTKNLVDEA